MRALDGIAAQFFGEVPPASADPLRLARPGAPPFLIMHGDDDHRIGLRQSERLRDGLAAAGVPASLIVVPGADHAGPEFSSPELVAQAVRFLRESWTGR